MTNKIIEALKELDYTELHDICRECNSYDGSLDWLVWEEFSDDFFDIYFSGRPMEAARATHFGNVNWSDNWIRFNAYGNLETICSLAFEDFESYLDDIADAIERLYGKIYVPSEIDEIFETANELEDEG